jgi:hypothetical protein
MSATVPPMSSAPLREAGRSHEERHCHHHGRSQQMSAFHGKSPILRLGFNWLRY